MLLLLVRLWGYKHGMNTPRSANKHKLPDERDRTSRWKGNFSGKITVV